jgi:hypothetical protein
MTADGIDRFIFVAYMCAYVLQIYNYTLSGSMLIYASLRVQESAYHFAWYRCDARIRTQILMIITRAQRKVNIDVPFFEVSLETFAWVRFVTLFSFSLSAFVECDFAFSLRPDYPTRRVFHHVDQDIPVDETKEGEAAVAAAEECDRNFGREYLFY